MRYLVGADGSRSTVREAAGITEKRTEHDRLMALLVFNSTELHELLQRYPGKAIYKVLHPDLEGYWMFFGRVDHGRSWFFHAPVPPSTTVDNYDFEALLHRAVGRPFDLELAHVGLWELRIAFADRYRSGRVFIAGDAAHSHPPYGGYGINTGFEDARNLGLEIGSGTKGLGRRRLARQLRGRATTGLRLDREDFIARYIDKDRQCWPKFSPQKDACSLPGRMAGAGARHLGRRCLRAELRRLADRRRNGRAPTQARWAPISTAPVAGHHLVATVLSERAIGI